MAEKSIEQQAKEMADIARVVVLNAGAFTEHYAPRTLSMWCLREYLEKIRVAFERYECPACGRRSWRFFTDGHYDLDEMRPYISVACNGCILYGYSDSYLTWSFEDDFLSWLLALQDGVLSVVMNELCGGEGYDGC